MGSFGLEAAEKQRQRHGGGMCDYLNGAARGFHLVHFALGFHQRRAQSGVGVIFGNESEIDDGAIGFGFGGELQSLAAGFRRCRQDDRSRAHQVKDGQRRDGSRLVPHDE